MIEWLVGLYDGEGTIGLYHGMHKDGHIRFTAAVDVVNTNYRIIQRVSNILDTYDIAHVISERSSGNTKHKTAYLIKVRNNHQALKLVSLLKPHLVGKRKQAETLERYLLRRTVSGQQRRRYDEADLLSSILISQLNANGNRTIEQVLDAYANGLVK